MAVEDIAGVDIGGVVGQVILWVVLITSCLVLIGVVGLFSLWVFITLKFKIRVTIY